MDQKQLDDLESKETQEEQSKTQEEQSESGMASTPDNFSESNLTSEEKVNDVNDILDNNIVNGDNADEKVEILGGETPEILEEKSLDENEIKIMGAGDLDEQSEPDEVSNPDEQSEPDTASEEKTDAENTDAENTDAENTDAEKTDVEKTAEEKSTEDSWNVDNDNNNDSKPGSTWRLISGVLLILLVVAIYTNGFNFTGAASVNTLALTQIDAEDKVLDYVNENLLRPPFTAEVKSSEELGSLFRVMLDVGGQDVESYITKDGRFFFPQGFDLEMPLDFGEDLEAPEIELVDVSVDDDSIKGDPNAPVTIIEFSEFQCPFCKKYVDEAYLKIIEEYVDAGKVRYVFRDFPLGFHDQAKPAAMASECAHEQGKYWEYHDLLFENQVDLSIENYKKWAVDLGLDTGQFNDCLDTEKYAEEVDNDLADGQSYGVSGTPAFFINGKMISGAQPYAVFEQAIEEALEGAEEPGLEELEEQIEEETEEVAEETELQEPEPTIKEIQITAKKWRFDPKHIEVNQGDQIKLVITTEEIDIKFILSAFGVFKGVAAGESVTVEFVADKKGTFEFLCGDYCNKYGAVQGTALNGELVVN
jgi:protein-disulfide isomerase